MPNQAWVTLATNDTYALGALVLAHSLRRVGTTRQIVVLISPQVTESMRELLGKVCDSVRVVDVLDSRDPAHLALIGRPDLGVTFTKFHCWTLTEFTRCVFLDADTLVVQKCDELFNHEELTAAPDPGWPSCFNSGVFVFTPSTETFSGLLKAALEDGSFDGGDQGLLNLYFNDWYSKSAAFRLPFTYNMTANAYYTYLAAYKHFQKDVKIVHFLGAAKPWDQDAGTSAHHALWWDIFTKDVRPTVREHHVLESYAIQDVRWLTSHPVVFASGNHRPHVIPHDIYTIREGSEESLEESTKENTKGGGYSGDRWEAYARPPELAAGKSPEAAKSTKSVAFKTDLIDCYDITTTTFTNVKAAGSAGAGAGAAATKQPIAYTVTDAYQAVRGCDLVKLGVEKKPRPLGGEGVYSSPENSLELPGFGGCSNSPDLEPVVVTNQVNLDEIGDDTDSFGLLDSPVLSETDIGEMRSKSEKSRHISKDDDDDQKRGSSRRKKDRVLFPDSRSEIIVIPEPVTEKKVEQNEEQLKSGNVHFSGRDSTEDISVSEYLHEQAAWPSGTVFLSSNDTSPRVVTPCPGRNSDSATISKKSLDSVVSSSPSQPLVINQQEQYPPRNNVARGRDFVIRNFKGPPAAISSPGLLGRSRNIPTPATYSPNSTAREMAPSPKYAFFYLSESDAPNVSRRNRGWGWERSEDSRRSEISDNGCLSPVGSAPGGFSSPDPAESPILSVGFAQTRHDEDNGNDTSKTQEKKVLRDGSVERKQRILHSTSLANCAGRANVPRSSALGRLKVYSFTMTPALPFNYGRMANEPKSPLGALDPELEPEPARPPNRILVRVRHSPPRRVSSYPGGSTSVDYKASPTIKKNARHTSPRSKIEYLPAPYNHPMDNEHDPSSNRIPGKTSKDADNAEDRVAPPGRQWSWRMTEAFPARITPTLRPPEQPSEQDDMGELLARMDVKEVSTTSRQAWEAGQMDVKGADAWENIQRKLDSKLQ